MREPQDAVEKLRIGALEQLDIREGHGYSSTEPTALDAAFGSELSSTAR